MEAVPAVSLCLLFLLMAGISASVDVQLFRNRFSATRGIVVGLASQFLLMPFLGFCSARAFALPEVVGITLIATTCSPGGAYSNWWCSLFNADLALSVAMTTCSSVMSTFMMPLNLFLYVRLTYGASLPIQWWKLILSLAVALSAIVAGMMLSYCLPRRRSKFNALGNLAGVALIVFGMLTSSRDEPLWNKDLRFYVSVSLPCAVGLLVALALAGPCRLEPPQRVAVAVETCYQNTGIALTLALAAFPEEQRAAAAGVPLFYGVVEVLLLPLFLLVAWRLGLTYAPRSEWLHLVLLRNYQPRAPAPGLPCQATATDDVPVPPKEQSDAEVEAPVPDASTSAGGSSDLSEDAAAYTL